MRADLMNTPDDDDDRQAVPDDLPAVVLGWDLSWSCSCGVILLAPGSVNINYGPVLGIISSELLGNCNVELTCSSVTLSHCHTSPLSHIMSQH